MKVTIKVEFPTDVELNKMFDAVPKLNRYDVGDKAVRAGAKPITQRAQQLMPRSKEADKAKWSKSRREGTDKRWSGLDKVPLWKTVKLVVRKHNRGAVAITGPEFVGTGGAGQKVYLVAEHKQDHRNIIAWGRPTGKTVQKIRNVMVQAAEEVRGQTLSAMKAKLTTIMDQMWRG